MKGQDRDNLSDLERGFIQVESGLWVPWRVVDGGGSGKGERIIKPDTGDVELYGHVGIFSGKEEER